MPTAASPSGGPLVTGDLPDSTGVAWGTPIGALSLRFYCPPQPGVGYNPLVECAATGLNVSVTGATAGGVTPGTATLQCNVSYVSVTLTGFPFGSTPTLTTIGGTVPVRYTNPVTPSGRASITLGTAGTLTVTGPSAPGFTTGSWVRIGAGGGPGLVNLTLPLMGAVATHPILASS